MVVVVVVVVCRFDVLLLLRCAVPFELPICISSCRLKRFSVSSQDAVKAATHCQQWLPDDGMAVVEGAASHGRSGFRVAARDAWACGMYAACISGLP